ncbi:MAG: hypothetical protein HY646_21430 [Acidobacteria bacterium]|nr:hypothetical protein [Acidobacteriota bacterium]
MDPVTLLGNTSNATRPATNRGEEQKTQFLKLLVAQLKGQNPLNPQDGAEFVSQLAQFTSLEELINIRTILERSNSSNESNNIFNGTVGTGNE